MVILIYLCQYNLVYGLGFTGVLHAKLELETEFVYTYPAEGIIYFSGQLSTGIGLALNFGLV